MEGYLISAPVTLVTELNCGWIIAIVTLLTACVPAGVAMRSLLGTLAAARARRQARRARPRAVVRLAAARHL